MILRAIFLLSYAALPALASSTPAPSTIKGAAPEQQGDQPLYKSIWHDDSKGDITHLQSGLVCDAQVGLFQRTRASTFKPDGLDVSCNYLDAARSDITLYVTRRADQTLDADMAEAEREMLSVTPDALNISISGTIPVALAKSAFYSRRGGQIREGIWIGDLNGWTLEYRATWKPDDETATLNAIEALTAMVTRTAGAQLALCSKSPPPSRDGVALTDKSEIQQTLIMASIMMGGMAMSSKTVEAPRIWCAESVVGEGDDSYLLWRAVHTDGTDAQADKLTGFTVDEPSPLTSEADAMTNLVLTEAAKGQSRKPRWTLEHTSSTGTWLYGFYEGRPTASELAKMASNIDHDKTKPLGGFDPKTKKITIVTDQ